MAEGKGWKEFMLMKKEEYGEDNLDLYYSHKQEAKELAAQAIRQEFEPGCLFREYNWTEMYTEEVEDAISYAEHLKTKLRRDCQCAKHIEK